MQNSNKKRVALGMSGGVDSSVAAHLLVEQGYDVTGVYLECWRAPGCRSEEDRKDALKVALSLGIPFEVLDFKDAYKQKVVENFFTEYEAGRTPNPDVLCNKEIKFGLFYEWAMAHEYDFIATGHYAALSKIDGNNMLTIPADAHKDQTYFLYLTPQTYFDKVLFPLGGFTKQAIRNIAKTKHIHVAEKKDSVGICFIGDINVHDFLKERLGERPGEVVTKSGAVIGKHKGLWFYTIGQRHGFEVNKKSLVTQADGTVLEKDNIPPFYVIAKNPAKNQLVVGFGADTYFTKFSVDDLRWFITPSNDVRKLTVRIRHTGALLPCQISLESVSSSVLVRLQEPVQGIAEGQSAVFYQTLDSGQTVLAGGGIISSTFST